MDAALLVSTSASRPRRSSDWPLYEERPNQAGERRRRRQRPDDVPRDPGRHEVVAHGCQVPNVVGVTGVL
jgi:hypothetical protein